mmetsp:Transcript_21944/g.68290  ORF Transcript_21944/g.68290 Transcript_21944/m.68290 type:complete len:201 (+) Transcript_21944:212-814(+)
MKNKAGAAAAGGGVCAGSLYLRRPGSRLRARCGRPALRRTQPGVGCSLLGFWRHQWRHRWPQRRGMLLARGRCARARGRRKDGATAQLGRAGAGHIASALGALSLVGIGGRGCLQPAELGGELVEREAVEERDDPEEARGHASHHARHEFVAGEAGKQGVAVRRRARRVRGEAPHGAVELGAQERPRGRAHHEASDHVRV